MSLLSEKSAFLFDLDGTLVDSSPLHEKAYLETLKSHGIQAPFRYEDAKGRSTQDYLAILLPEENKARRQILTDEKQARYREFIATLQPLPGAKDLLDFLKSEGKTLYVVTGGSRRSSNQALEAVGLSQYFEAKVTADDTARCKPAPDPYLKALSLTGLPANQSIAIEDAESGVISCRAANLDVILVNNEEAGHRIQPYFPDLTVLLKSLQ